MLSKAKTVKEYLAELPADRRAAMEGVRKVILDNLDDGFEEGMLYDMIGYYVPHSIYPAGYHCDPTQPLCFAGIGSQKNHVSLYLMSIYGDAEQAKRFREDWAKTGKKLDMGKACIRFKSLDDLPLDVIGRAVARVKVKNYIATCEAAVSTRKRTKSSGSGQRAKAKARR